MSIGFAIDFRTGLSQQERIGLWAARPGTAEEPGSLGAAQRIHRIHRDPSTQPENAARPARGTPSARGAMFDISCGDDGGPASCGIFGGSVGGGGGAKQPQTLAGLLKKLDLSEYEPKFVAAGITDVR